MALTTETIIVLAVVAVAVAWAVRALVRTVRRDAVCSSCATSADCPVNKDPELIEDLLEARGRARRDGSPS